MRSFLMCLVIKNKPFPLSVLNGSLYWRAKNCHQLQRPGLVWASALTAAATERIRGSKTQSMLTTPQGAQWLGRYRNEHPRVSEAFWVPTLLKSCNCLFNAGQRILIWVCLQLLKISTDEYQKWDILLLSSSAPTIEMLSKAAEVTAEGMTDGLVAHKGSHVYYISVQNTAFWLWVGHQFPQLLAARSQNLMALWWTETEFLSISWVCNSSHLQVSTGLQ